MLLRVSDILEDNNTKSKEDKIQDLYDWADILENKGDCSELVKKLDDLDHEDPEVIVALRSQELIEYLSTFPQEVQDIVIKHVVDTTKGMARWQKDGPVIDTVEDMDDYMHEVAGRVGYLITELFAVHSTKIEKKKSELMPLAREFGLALQSVNIIQGMRKDYLRGWIFTPNSFFEKVKISTEDFFNVSDEDKALEVIDLLVKKAENHLRKGLEFVMAIPKSQVRIRLACMWPLFFAVKTLVLSNKNLDLLRKDVKITRTDVNEIISSTMLRGLSNTWTKNYYYKLLKEGQLMPQPIR